jgi:bifunctional DNase/RNase
VSDADEVTFRVVQVADVAFDFFATTSNLVLLEAEGQRRELIIPIALADATAIHQAWKHLVGRRPTTNELATFILQELHADIIAARIVRLEAGVFYAELDLMTPKGRRVFDCRPSDAIALALRQAVAAPLLVAEDVLAQG